MATLVEDAVQLIYWFEKQSDGGTYLKDREIAERLGWVEGGRPVGANQRVTNTAFGRSNNAKGDAGRVRRARRYVDRHNEDGLFAGYSFGTKTNGSGVKFMMLFTPKMTQSLDAVNEATSEQMSRAVQQTQQAASERARMVSKLLDTEKAYSDSGDYQRAMVVHDAIKELQIFGQLTMSTVQSARELGILSAIQGAA